MATPKPPSRGRIRVPEAQRPASGAKKARDSADFRARTARTARTDWGAVADSADFAAPFVIFLGPESRLSVTFRLLAT